MANFENHYSNYFLSGTTNDDVIKNYSDNVTINGEYGKDLIINGKFFAKGGIGLKIYDGEGSDTITNSGSKSLIDSGSGNDLIHNGYYYYQDWNAYYEDSYYGEYNDSNESSNVTINAGAGDDSIYNRGNNVTINAGTGNNYIYSTGNNVLVNVDGGINKVEGQNIIVSGSYNNDTLIGSKGVQIFQYSYGGGNDVIVNYSGEDIVQITNGKIDGYSFDKGDLIFHIGSGSLRLKNMTNHAITVKDSTGTSTKIYSNGYTPQDVIKKFMKSMSLSSLTDFHLAVDEAVQNCSNFKSMQEVIDQFFYDCQTAINAESFLKDSCGIILDNEDIGAITGWDAGGLKIKTDESMVDDIGVRSYPNSTTFTKRGLTLVAPDRNTLNEVEQNFIEGLYSWWLDGALKLVEESYGLSFVNNERVMNVTFVDGPYFLAVCGNDLQFYKEAIPSIDLSNSSGLLNYGGYIDTAIAHEMTHAVMGSNISVPNWSGGFCEGTAELVRGIERDKDVGNSVINSYAGNVNDLKKALAGANGYDSCIAWNMLLRYFAKQVSDNYDSLASYSLAQYISISNDNTVINGGSGNDSISAGNSAKYITIYAGDGKDTITGNYYNSKIFGGAGNDYINVVDSDVYKYGSYALMLSKYSRLSDSWKDNLTTTIDGGDGDDVINVVGFSPVSIDGGAGNDKISLAGDYGYLPSRTIKGGKGNDIIYGVDDKVKTGALEYCGFVGTYYEYSYGDGNDTIYNYHGNDTISIGGTSSYTTLTSGDNFVISVSGSGSITLYNDSYNSTKDKKVNIVGGKYEEALNISIGGGGGIGGQSLGSGTDNDDTLPTGISIKSSVLTASAKFTGSTINLANYSNATKVSAANVPKSLNIVGNSSNNSLKGGKGADTINGDFGKDTILGGAGNDKIYGGNDNDLLKGEVGNDTIYGDSGNDTLYGGEGTDKLYGNAGNDKILGDAENDSLYGGSGNDTLTGGTGNDVFVYESGNDIITDYTAGQDKIKISNGKISKTSYSGKNVVFTIGNGSLTVKNAKGKNISVIDSSNKTQSYSRTLDLMYDNNFVTEELQIEDVSKVMADNYSVGQIEYSTDSGKIVDMDTPVLTTNFEKK